MPYNRDQIEMCHGRKNKINNKHSVFGFCFSIHCRVVLQKIIDGGGEINRKNKMLPSCSLLTIWSSDSRLKRSFKS